MVRATNEPPKDLAPDEDFTRASGDFLCPICERLYWHHPSAGPLGAGDRQFLKRTCDGRLVKL